MERLRTQVAIIGGGPAGLMLQLLLHAAGVESVVLEQRTRAYVEARIRAGLLEDNTVRLLEDIGVAERLHAQGLVHGGISIASDGAPWRIDFEALVGRTVTVYGQTEITHDLFVAAERRGCPVVFEAADVVLHEVDGERPYVVYRTSAGEQRIDCDFIAGCDGGHGRSRYAIPEGARALYERVYPFAWLGILADVPPCHHELIYARSERGFALATMRSATRSRYYVQTPADERLEDWPDERFWDELCLRLGPEAAAHVTRGPSIEKSLAALRSFVAEPMSWGQLFLAGDAAHIVPPTGAKGLNLAASDARYLAEALIEFYRTGSNDALAGYSQKALARVWKAERFSWWFTHLTHRFPDEDLIETKLKAAELDYLRGSAAAQTALAENYVGLAV
jgi:p-hydroxybenzoate 3-monooxygenase